MLIKAKTPWWEFAYIGILLWIASKFTWLTIERGEMLGLLFTAAFLVMVTFLAIHINRTYRSIYLTSPLQIRGYFWGKIELNLEDIQDFKTKEIKGNRGGAVMFSEHFLIICRKNKTKLKILKENYAEGKIDLVAKWLSTQGVTFLGHEPFSWRAAFKDLLRGRIFYD